MMGCLEDYLDVHVRGDNFDGNRTRQNRTEAHSEFQAMKSVFKKELPDIGDDIESFLASLWEKRAVDSGLSRDASWREIEQATRKSTRKKTRKRK